MPLIANPWAQDAAAFGQQAGQALSQGLLQLPQQRYALALQQAEMQRALQQMAMTQQYRQGQLGLGQQRLENQQQGLASRNQNEEMANQIRMLMAQIAAANSQYQHEQPLVVPAGSSVYDRNSLMGGQQQPTTSPDFGPFGDQLPQGLPKQGQPSPQAIAPIATSPGRATTPPPISQSQVNNDFLRSTLPMIGMYGTNVVTKNPALWKSFTNFQATGQVPQGWGQQATNASAVGLPTQQALTNNPANPQVPGQKIASEGVIQQALQQSGGDAAKARQLLQSHGFVIPQ